MSIYLPPLSVNKVPIIRYGAILAILVTISCLLWVMHKSLHNYYVEEYSRQDVERAKAYQASVLFALERHDPIPQILTYNTSLFENAFKQPQLANETLAAIQQRSHVEYLYILNERALTVAASNWGQADSFVGHNYAFRPYYKNVLDFEKGAFFGIGTTTNLPGYYVSARYPPDPAVPLQAVAVAKIDLAPLTERWQSAGDTLFISNQDGIVVLSSQPQWLYQTLEPLTTEQVVSIQKDQQFPGDLLRPLNYEMSEHEQLIVIDGITYMRQALEVGKMGWILHYLTPYARINQAVMSFWVLALLGLFALCALLLGIRFVHTRSALQQSQGEFSHLQELNHCLEKEIIERKQIEAELRKAQTDLRRTSRLAAMGQLSASITHELGQPLSAMRTYLASLQLSMERQTDQCVEDGREMGHFRTLTKLQALVGRMTSITRQLRYFARSDTQEVQAINLADTIQGALEIIQPTLEAKSVELRVQTPDQPVWVMASEVRLEQVLVNLIRNAVDAMFASPQKLIELNLQEKEGMAILQVSDSGPGLPQKDRHMVFEPFFSTKPSGIGMGLGLTISSDIIADLGGQLLAENHPQGGACFVVKIPIFLKL